MVLMFIEPRDVPFRPPSGKHDGFIIRLLRQEMNRALL
jgi:hypothetical protein